jgi:hypothetical protein
VKYLDICIFLSQNQRTLARIWNNPIKHIPSQKTGEPKKLKSLKIGLA